jgi:DNA processing protein
MDSDNRELTYGIHIATLPRAQRVQLCKQALESGSFAALGTQCEVVQDKFEIDIKKCEKQGIKLVALTASNYPAWLKEIYDPPSVLYYRGELSAISTSQQTIAIVGGRKASLESCMIIEEFSSELARSGMHIASGLAHGIDGAAHQGALSSGIRGSTTAVVAHGLDMVYPSAHRRLAERIIEEGGLVISEYPVGTKPLKHHFPERNRLIAGISQGVLIVEAREQSGSLITARLATEEGRDVFVIPGPIKHKQWGGSLRLLKTGAIPVTELSDILDYYDIPLSTCPASCHLDPELEILFAKHETVHLNDILRSSIGHSTILTRLCESEAAGIVKRLPGNYFTLSVLYSNKHR